MVDDQDVIPGSSPGSEGIPAPDATAAPGVTGVASEPTERPIENLKAEMDRKLTKVERQQQEILAALAALTSRPAVEAAPAPEYTDQQLLELANAGNAAAHQEYTRRIVAQQVGQQMQVSQQQQMVAGQLQSLYGRYPQLTDPSHALTQAAMQAKLALIRAGYPAQSAATDLEAIKLAIVDHPDLAQPRASGPPGSPGGAGRTPQQGIDGATPRRPVSPTAPARALSQKERDIAARMGIKDPAEALKRFEKRNQEGRVSMSQQVAQILREETP